jgi:hypothetical protein
LLSALAIISLSLGFFWSFFGFYATVFSKYTARRKFP